MHQCPFDRDARDVADTPRHTARSRIPAARSVTGSFDSGPQSAAQQPGKVLSNRDICKTCGPLDRASRSLPAAEARCARTPQAAAAGSADGNYAACRRNAAKIQQSKAKQPGKAFRTAVFARFLGLRGRRLRPARLKKPPTTALPPPLAAESPLLRWGFRVGQKL